MAKHEENQAFMSRRTSPTKEDGQEDQGDVNVDHDFSGSGCGCFRLFCFERGSNDGGGEGWRLLQQKLGEEDPQKESWLVSKLKKVRELSEVVAGPKWKNLVRKLGKYINKNKIRTHHHHQQQQQNHYHYSPQSYALNFDEREVDDYMLGYSATGRFAPPFSGGERPAAGS